MRRAASGSRAWSRPAAAGRRARPPPPAPRRRGTGTPGPEPGEPGDRVEQVLRQAHDEADRSRAAAPRDRGGRRCAWVPAAIAAAPSPMIAGVFGIARTTGRPGAAASSAAIVTPAAIDSTSCLGPSAAPAALERVGDVAGLQAHDTTSASATAHADARHHTHVGKLGLELAPALGVDFGDRQIGGVEVCCRAGRRSTRRPSSRRRAAPHESRGGG